MLTAPSPARSRDSARCRGPVRVGGPAPPPAGRGGPALPAARRGGCSPRQRGCGTAACGARLASSPGKVFLPGVGLTHARHRVNWFPGELVSNSVSLRQKRVLSCPPLRIFYHNTVKTATAAERRLRCAGRGPSASRAGDQPRAPGSCPRCSPHLRAQLTATRVVSVSSPAHGHPGAVRWLAEVAPCAAGILQSLFLGALSCLPAPGDPFVLRLLRDRSRSPPQTPAPRSAASPGNPQLFRRTQQQQHRRLSRRQPRQGGFGGRSGQCQQRGEQQ